jgi:hypothetical protein
LLLLLLLLFLSDSITLGGTASVVSVIGARIAVSFSVAVAIAGCNKLRSDCTAW